MTHKHKWTEVNNNGMIACECGVTFQEVVEENAKQGIGTTVTISEGEQDNDE